MDATSLQQGQILAALSAEPLDRIRLMKTLFLIWHRNGCPETGPFTFEPYLYGPCAFDLYTALENLERRGLVAQAPHAVSRWARYHLTEAGRRAAEMITDIDESQRKQIAEIARWAARQGFHTLLNQVYQEAPNYATQSVLR